MSIAPTPTEQEAAAVLAAIAEFDRDTIPPQAGAVALSPWKRAALTEGVSTAPEVGRTPPRWAAS